MAVNDVTIPKKYVYVQSTEPTGIATGTLWYNTLTDTLYSYDGTSFLTISTDITELSKQQLEQNINILINSASATSTLNDYEDMFLDIFSDANGYSNTINTTNTTAIFNTDEYNNDVNPTDVANSTAKNPDSTNNNTYKRGVKIKAKANVYLTKIEKYTTSTPTKAYLYATDGETLLATSDTFDGHNAIFSTPYLMVANTSYYLVCDAEGSSFTTATPSGGLSLPLDLTTIEITTGVSFDSATPTESIYCGNVRIVYTNTNPVVSNKTIETNKIDILENPQSHQVFCHNTTNGTGSIDYDISFDNGTTWITGQELNIKNTSVHNGSEMILKLNLKGSGTGNNSLINDYAVMLYY